MKLFSRGALWTPKLQRIQVTLEEQGESCWKEDLNTTVEHLFEEMVGFPKVSYLRLSEYPELVSKWHGQLPVSSSWSLRSLLVDKCSSFLSVLPSKLLPLLRNLEELDVRSCNSIQEIFDLEGLNPDDNLRILSGLSKLCLINLPKLRCLWSKNPEGILHFGNLKSLEFHDCSSLRSIFTISVALNFVQLEKISVKNCAAVEGIVVRDEAAKCDVDKIAFPKLISITLDSLPNLMGFLLGGCTLECPSITSLLVTSCPKMTAIVSNFQEELEPEKVDDRDGKVPEKIAPPLFDGKVSFPNVEHIEISGIDKMEKLWQDEVALYSFCKLKTLKVEHCGNLLFLVPSKMVQNLQNLETLSVRDCSSLQEIFQLDEQNQEESTREAAFCLKELTVSQLPRMKRMWNRDPQGNLTFRNLQKVVAYKCESLENLFPASVGRDLVQLEYLQVTYCGVKEIVSMDNVGELTAQFYFPRITTIFLHDLPELRRFYAGSFHSEWPLLKELRVYHCDKANIFTCGSEFYNGGDSESQQNSLVQEALFSFEKVIPKLERLMLTSKDSSMICKRKFRDEFTKLKFLSLGCFHDEPAIFPTRFLLESFYGVETLVLFCSSFEEIFPNECGTEEILPCSGFGDATEMTRGLGRLKKLVLPDLHNLRHVWGEGSLSIEILRRIGSLTIRNCPSLMTLIPATAMFENLTSLSVESSAGLTSLIMSSATKYLVQLITMTITKCQTIKEIVVDDNSRAEEEISFSQLKHLRLHDLSSLTSFSSINCTFIFPCLEELTVEDCPKMKTFSNEFISAPKLDRVQLRENDKNGRWDGDLNTTIQRLSIK